MESHYLPDDQYSAPKAFLIHGRDHAARDAVRDLLTAMGVAVVTWPHALRELPTDKHDIHRVVDKGFSLSTFVVVLLTPDEVAYMLPEHHRFNDTAQERGPRFQPRPNVILELGYALRTHEDRTVCLVVGDSQLPSDLKGKWIITLRAGAPEEEPISFREQVAQMLESMVRHLVDKQVTRETADRFSHDMRAGRDRWLAAGDIEGLNKRESRRTPVSIIEAGTEIRTSKFNWRAFFSQGDEFILTGTNFGDQMGDPGTPPGLLHQLIVETLRRSDSTSVYLVIAPYKLLDSMIANSTADFIDRSACRLKMLQHDPRLTERQRGRLHIFDHRGAAFLSIALRDPADSAGNKGLAVVTPRWFKDEAGPSRMFFSIEKAFQPAIFKTFIDPIYPSIKVDMHSFRRRKDNSTLGGRTIDEICEELGVGDDPYLPYLAST